MDRVPAFRHVVSLAGALALGSLATPALAAPEPSTRLVRCGAESCLQISGKRDDPTAIVSVNGRAVPVEGGRSWRVELPVEQLREWSAPYARTVEIAMLDPETELGTISSVDLPIGVLGGVTNLASLVVSAR